MTKTHALRRLLEHGPMTRPEIVECTRWTSGAVGNALGRCLRSGYVVRYGFDGKLNSYRSRINGLPIRPHLF
jgi:hypothetical protein